MEFVPGFVAEVFAKILDCSCAPVKRHISYAFNFRSKVNKLGDEVRKLANDKEQLELSVEGAQRQGEEILNTVKDWQIRAGEAIKEAEKLIELGEEEAQKSCSARLCLNSKKCYDIGRKAEEKTPGIIQLHEERGGFVSISCRPPLQQIVKPPVEGYEAESRNKILKEVMDALLDSNVNMVGVYGMGGIGKTTLAKEVHGQAKRGKLFEHVILATVTATPELRRVQGEIADMLELKLDEETEVGRASRLYQKLKGRSILIILDDLWNMLELEKVGIPTGNDSRGCKILLTSRRLDVLSEMGSQKNFSVQLLSEEEAKNLFEIQVADVKDSKIEEEILLKCAGFPLLIVTVAGLLKNKDSHFWKCTLMQLSMFDDREIEAKVYSVLESSYNNLPHEDNKLIFLLCGICGQTNTSISNLLKYSLGLGLGLFKRCTVEMARIRLCKLMDDLKSSSLLLDINKAGVVRMHDTVRDFALWMASRDRVFRVIDAANPLRVWPSRDELEKCKIISLPYCDIKELPEDLYLGCPDAEFFLFSSIGDSLDISNFSFEGIKLLKVLCFSGVCFSPLPKSFGFLTSLQTLCLDGCQLGDMAMIGQLKKLEILSFCRSELESLPSEIGELSKLKLLDLSYCSKLRVIPANVISKLSSLEELLMRDSFNEWEIEEHSNSNNARLSELESLSHLSSLEMHVPNAKALPRNLFSTHLERFQILIGDWYPWNRDEDYKRSKTLKLKLNTDIDVLDRVKILLKETEALYLGNMSRTMNVLPDEVIGGFSKLRELTIVNCNKLKNIFSPSMIRSLSQLEKMEVSQCDGVEGIVVDEGDREFDGNEVVEFSRLCTLKLSSLPQLEGFIYKKKSSPVPETTASTCAETILRYELGTPLPLFDKMAAFSCLEKLHVSKIDNIETIWHHQITNLEMEGFPKLRELMVDSCNKLKNIFNLSMIKSLSHLEEMQVFDCEGMEGIVVEEGDCGFDGNKAVEFSRLHNLKLDRLPQLKSFVYEKKSSTVSEATTPRCSETTSSSELGTPRPLFDKMVAFPCLEVLQVWSIGNIRIVFPSGISGRFHKLKSLRVWDCDLLEEIYQFQDLNVERPNETLKFELKHLDLEFLPKLKNVWSRSGRFFTFENLEVITIVECRALENIFPSGISGRFQKLKLLKVWACDLVEEIYQFQDLNVERPNETLKFELKSLHLFSLPKLKNVWSSSGRFFTFENLKSIQVHRCRALKNIFPAFIAKKFPQLKTLSVGSCGKLEEIVAREESGSNIPSFSFPQLTSLKLVDLREMRSFYPRRHTLECPKLNDMTLRGCHKASILISESSSSCLHQTRGEGPQHDDIISHDQRRFFLLGKVISNLEHMSMDGTLFKTISHSPLSIQYLIRLSSLSLCDFRGMTISQFGVFESMPNLRQLEVRDSYLKELWRYRRVDGDQTDSVTSPLPYIKILKLSSVEGLKHVWRQDSQMNPLLQYLETLYLTSCENLISLAPSSYASFQNLTSLEISDCNQMINLMNLSVAKTMANLVEIKITSCNALKEIVAAEDGQDNGDKITNESIVFNKLKTLELDDLENLIGFCMSRCYSFHFLCLEEVSMKRCPSMRIFCDGNLYTPKLGNINSGGLDRDLKATIKQSYEEMIEIQHIESLRLSRFPQLIERWHRQLPFEFFSSLQKLVVDKCALFSSAIPSNLLPFLDNLKKLVVEQCHSIEEVFHLDGLNVAEGHVGLLSQLSKLKLIELPKLRHVWNDDPLRILGIRNLRELKVHRCGSLRNIFTLPMAVGLVNLWSLEVKECALVEVIIKKEGEDEADWDRKTMFPLLVSIELEHLPNLVNFYSGGHVLRCPSLSNVYVVGCPKMPVYGCSSCSRGEQLPSSTIVEIHGEGLFEGSVDDMTTLRFFNGEIEIASLKELVVEWNSAVNDIWHAIFPAPFLCTLEGIMLTGFPAELPLLPSGFLHSLPNLDVFVVGDSFSEIIFPKEVNTVKEIQPASPFAELKILMLFNLPNLKHLVEDDSQLGSLFQHLEELEVIKCSGLIRLITSSMAKGLVKLRKMVVKECERMTEIFPKEVNTIKEIQQASPFAQLEILKLFDLPNLKHLVEDDSQVGSLFQSLRKLKVIKCNGLIRLITSSTAKGLVNLQKMVVKECERMTEIVASEANEVETDGGFCELKYLELHDLPLLTSFSSNCTLNFPILQEVIVRECPKMMIFARNGLRMPLLDGVQIGEDEDAWRWEGSLNTTIEKMFLETNVQDV